MRMVQIGKSPPVESPLNEECRSPPHSCKTVHAPQHEANPLSASQHLALSCADTLGHYFQKVLVPREEINIQPNPLWGEPLPWDHFFFFLFGL